MSNSESRAMLRNVIEKVRESGKTNVEATAWVFAQTVEIIKEMPDVKPATEQKLPAPVPAMSVDHDATDHDATGPKTAWKPPVGGFYRHDGRFVKDETWKPAEKPAVEESKPSVPDVLAQIQQGTPVKSDKRMVEIVHQQTGFSRLVPWTPELQQQLDREAADARTKDKIVFVPKPKPKAASDTTVPTRVVANTHTDQMAHCVQTWSEPTVERN